jgi:DNA-binding NarL/FixJ family response regulator
MLRVIICDDQTVVREGLAAILSTDDEIEVVGLAGNGQEALALAAELEPDVVLMDLKMPVMNGVQATLRLRTRYPAVRVLVLTTYAEDGWVFDAVRAGAAGYLLKDTRRDDLVQAIKGTAAGQSFIAPAVAGKLMRHVAEAPPSVPPGAPGPGGPAAGTPLTDALTERELDVLRLLVKGHSNPEIARRLHLAPGTVRNYVSGILQKLGAQDRTQAAVMALQLDLVDERTGGAKSH